MQQPRLKMAYGNWVAGDRFWGRETDLKLFISRIDSGAHSLLIAQRRMGKTSVMKETARRLEDRYLCLFVDLQKCDAAPDAVVELGLAVRPLQSIWKKAFGRITENLDGFNLGEIGVKLRADLAGEWARKGDELLRAVAGSEKPVLLLIDEAPILVNRILKGADYRITPERRQQADLFLSWLRENSVHHQGKIRIVLSGSIGLEPILRQGRLSASLNNFEPFELKPWDEETACACLEALAAEYNLEFEPGSPRRMVEMLGCCIPHHVQMFFRHTRDWAVRQHRNKVSRADIEAVYKMELLSIRGHAELTHYEERLKMVLGEETFPMALELLTETAAVGALTVEAMEVISKGYEFCTTTAPEARREILDVLEHDGYLERKGNRYHFVSKLLRDWWKARYGFGYVPTLKRGA